jgi:hypothetical protein
MRIIFTLSLLLLQACASLGPKYSSRENKVIKDKSIITVYRPWKYVGSAGDPYTCLDNTAVGEYYNGSFYSLEVGPGDHYVSWGTIDGQSKNGVRFVAKQGEQYFLRFDISKLSGAKEATQAGGMAGAGAVGYIATGAFFSQSSQEEIKRILDSRVQKEVNNQGLMFVKKEFAQTELQDTKLYPIKKYDTSWCASPK